MFADDILKMLRNSWDTDPLQNGVIRRFSNRNYPSIDHLDFIPRLGDLDPGERERLRSEILRLIESDRSNMVGGAYIYNNFTERPDNACLFIYLRARDHPPLSMVCFFRRNDINFSSAWIVSSEILRFVNDLVAHRDRVFIFAAGVAVAEYFSPIFQSYRQLHNTVYTLNREAFSHTRRLPEGFYYLLLAKPNLPLSGGDLDPTLAESIVKLKKFYDYNPVPKNFIQFLRSQAHILIFDSHSLEICAAARANSTTPKYSVIGGVHTLPDYRGKGLGTFMCSKLTEYLLTESEYVNLETDLTNFPARKIYEGLGFEPCGKSVFIDKGTDMITEIVGDRDY